LLLIPVLAEVRIPAGVLREKTTELIREAAATAAPESSSILGIGFETALSAAAGGGAVALGIGGVRLASRLLSKKKKEEGSTTIVQEPFPRRLDEARQLREMAFVSERRVPEYDAAVGRIVNEELTVRLANAEPKERELLNDFWTGVRDRVDRLMPPSTIEYRKAQ
jgi:hypothetical protein